MIRWITDNLGTAARIKVGAEPYSLLDVRDLVDKSGNPVELVRAKIEEGAAAVSSGKTVVVVCDLGVSRSNAIAAGVLARTKRIPIESAIKQVMEATKETNIKLDMANIVRAALTGDERDPSSRSTVLVTGGGGFFGRNLVERLAGHCQIVAPSRSELDLLESAVGLDILCRENNVAQIVHLAHPRDYTNNSAMGESLTMLLNVLDVCRVQNLRLVFPSGGVIYAGYRADKLIVDETVPAMPRGPYGETKYLQEQLIELACRQYGLHRTIVRLSPTYGPGSDRPRLIKTFHELASEGKDIYTHRYLNGPPLLDLLYIDDAVSGLIAAITAPVSGIFHIAPGEGYTTQEIAARIRDCVGHGGSILERPISDYVSNVILDSTRARSALNWQPKIDLEEGLRRTLGLS
ncbi:MAG: NAD-dependent epimerase/dehydratase family protein [Alphaproteobacteria bacterium]